MAEVAKDMTNVAVVVLEDIFVANGTTVRVHRVLDLLHKKHNVTVIACSDKSRGELEGLKNVHVMGIGRRLLVEPWVPFPLRLIRVLLWNLRLGLVLLRNRFDVVYCAHDWLGFLSVYLVSKVKRYKTIFESHSILSEESKELGHSSLRLELDQSLEKFVIMHSDFTIALSKNTFEFYQPYNRNIGLVPVFVDTDIPQTEIRPQGVFPKSIGLIGPFDINVRWSYYLNFLYDNIDRFDSRIRFIVIGRCDKRIEHDRIRYTGYLDSVHDYVDQLSHLDAVLVPEGVATSGPLNKILESMCCSLPVFTTPKGVVGLYWTEPGKHILVFEEDELVNKVNQLIFDDKLMAQIGRNARKVVEKYYSEKVNEEKLMRILELVTAGQQGSPLP